MFTERLEWLETEWNTADFSSEKKIAAAPGKRCPQCQWLDYASTLECFRCGYLFDHETANLLKLKQLHIQPIPFQLRIHPLEPWFYQGKAVSPETYQLRQEAEQVQLLPSFDTLISLSQLPITYYPHQIETCLRTLRELHGQALLADEVGLGKTVESGIILKELASRKLAKRILILVPAHLVIQWKQEMQEKFGEVFLEPQREDDWKQNRLILSLSKARGASKAHLITQKFDLIIVDEAHKLKNRHTKQYQVVEALQKKYILLLSATPFHNKLSELYNLVHLVKPGLFGTMKAFNRQFVDLKNKRYPKNVDHLRTLLKKVLIRNLRQEVGIPIPNRRVASYYLNFFPDEYEYYQTVSHFLKNELFALEKNYPLEKRSARMLVLMTLQRELCSSIPAAQKNLKNMQQKASKEMRQKLGQMIRLGEQISSSRKAQACLELLKRFPEKTIIFTEFKATVDYLVSFFKTHQLQAIPFTGDLNAIERTVALKKFQNEAQLLISTNSGGEGLNLQFARQMINYDLSWNPMTLEQRIGRIHRLGQTKDVFIFNLSVNGTIESKILELLIHKIQIFKIAIGELDLILGTLQNEKSFEELLKETWIQSLVENEEEAFQSLGKMLQTVSQEYQTIKESEELLSSLVNPSL